MTLSFLCRYYWAIEQEVIGTATKEGLMPFSMREVVWTHLQMLAHGSKMALQASIDEWVKPLIELKN